MSFWNWIFPSDKVRGEWSECPALNEARYGCAAVTLGGTIYVLGGHNGTHELDSLEIYRSDSHDGGRGGVWSTSNLDEGTVLLPMRTRRHACAATTLRGSIFALGGHDGEGSLHSGEKYCVRTGLWIPLPYMGQRRFDCGAVSYPEKDSVYVVGGHDGKHCTDTAEALCVAGSQRWRELPSMTTRRFQCAATVTGGRLYVLGGHNGECALDTGEVFDLETEVWSELPRMSSKRKGCAAAVVDGLVYVSGGHDDRTSLNSVEVYDPETCMWSPMPSMKYRRFGCAAAVMANHIYVVGGFDRNNMLESVELMTLHQNENTQAATDAPCDKPTAAPQSVPFEDGDIPNELICPITSDLMVDPVVASDGHTYEREAIEEWFSRFRPNDCPRSPKTNGPIERILYPNHNLRSMCLKFAT